MQNSDAPLTGRILNATAGAFLVTVLLIASIAFYSRDAPPANQFPITVAIVGLIGTLWTGAITLVGLLLKDAVDSRNALLQAESEKRLRMETALKAVEIMSSAETQGASLHESREAAILVIASLGQTKLAYNMAEQFWLRDKITPGSYVQIVDEIMAGTDDYLKNGAAYVIRRNAGRLVSSPHSVDFPNLGRIGELPSYAKLNLIFALVEMATSRALERWDPALLNWILLELNTIMQAKDDRYKYPTAMFASELCDALQLNPGDFIRPADGPEVTYADIRSWAQQIIQSGSGRRLDEDEVALLTKLKDWKTGNPGAIADAEVGAPRKDAAPAVAPPLPPKPAKPGRPRGGPSKPSGKGNRR